MERVQQALAATQREFGAVQRALGNLDRRYNVLLRIVGLINTTLDPQELLDNILEVGANALQAEAGSILLYDPQKEELYFAATRGAKGEEIRQFRIKSGEGLVGWGFAHNEPVIVTDAHEDDRFAKTFDEAVGFTTHAVLCSPIRVRGVPVGMFEMLNKQDDQPFVFDDIELLNTIAHVTGVVLGNARLISDLQAKAR